MNEIGAQNFPNWSKSISFREHFAGLCESCVCVCRVCVCVRRRSHWMAFHPLHNHFTVDTYRIVPNAHCTFAKHDLVTSWPTKFIAILIQRAWTLLLTLNKNIESFYRAIKRETGRECESAREMGRGNGEETAAVTFIIHSLLVSRFSFSFCFFFFLFQSSVAFPLLMWFTKRNDKAHTKGV